MKPLPLTPWSLLGNAPAILYLLFIGIPFVALFLRAIALGGLGESLSDPLVLRSLLLSLVTSLISMGIVVIGGTPLAYALARSRFLGHRLVDALVELPLVLPPVVAGLAMLMAFGRQSPLGRAMEEVGIVLPFTTAAVVFSQIFVSAPFYIRAARLGFQAVDATYEDLSRTLGRSPWDTFRRISLPLALPSLLGGLALAWARALSEFGATLMFAGNFPGVTQTMPLAILSALESDLSNALALAVILTIVSVALLGAIAFLSARRERIGL
ncbi:MAG: molybdate ABC transporter permease subunit [Chloroflexi bacterium]|nr:molybdate ABC transporter permease subunit [Chloroflexota bacterium]